MSESTTLSIKTILLTGLLAGTLDISAALTNAYISNGVTPIRVLQFIAKTLLKADCRLPD